MKQIKDSIRGILANKGKLIIAYAKEMPLKLSTVLKRDTFHKKVRTS